MEQRSLRLGDLVDDYCPRERRVTNHAIVAIVNEAIRQTRCTACDTEHVFKGGKAPRRRAKAGDGLPIDNTGGQLVTPTRADEESPVEIVQLDVTDVTEVSDIAGTDAMAASADAVDGAPTEPDGNGERRDDAWPANRQLIRATLPRVEGEQPPPRPIPEFTMHQRYSGRGAGAFRQARSWAEQGFGSARGGAGNGNGNGNGNGARGDRRPGQGQGQGQGFPGQGQGRRRHGKEATSLVGQLDGKTGLIVGVANKRSIAWAIAQAASAEGASLVLTYQNDRLSENVHELAATLPNVTVLPCDVASDEQIDAMFASIGERHDGLDFLVHGAAFAQPDALKAPFSQTSREGFRIALDISAYSLVALTRGAAPLMEKRGGGSILTLSYLGSTRVFPNYNVMGVAKAALEASVRYLASDLGSKGIRVNAISAGPIKTLAASGISGFSGILQAYRDKAPLRRTVETSEVADAAVFLLGPAGRAITAEVLMVDAGFHAMGI